MTGKFPPKDLTEEISPEMMFSWVIIFNSNLVAAIRRKDDRNSALLCGRFKGELRV